MCTTFECSGTPQDTCSSALDLFDRPNRTGPRPVETRRRHIAARLVWEQAISTPGAALFVLAPGATFEREREREREAFSRRERARTPLTRARRRLCTSGCCCRSAHGGCCADLDARSLRKSTSLRRDTKDEQVAEAALAADDPTLDEDDLEAACAADDTARSRRPSAKRHASRVAFESYVSEPNRRVPVAIFVVEATREVVVACRGTLSLEDCITDATARARSLARVFFSSPDAARRSLDSCISVSFPGVSDLGTYLRVPTYSSAGISRRRSKKTLSIVHTLLESLETR